MQEHNMQVYNLKPVVISDNVMFLHAKISLVVYAAYLFSTCLKGISKQIVSSATLGSVF